MSLKEKIKRLLPESALAAIAKYIFRALRRRHARLSTQQIFRDIYRRKLWSRSDEGSSAFCSGSGSHNRALVVSYVCSLQSFLTSFAVKPDVVDLGCGDFAVGSKLREYCGAYVAVDIVPELIENNRKLYGNMNVDFRIADLAADRLPEGDIAFIRQVFQHLSNEQIGKAVPRIAQSYRYLVITEHVPGERGFVPNVDKPTGPDTRLKSNSGVVLTAPPFHLKVAAERILCESPQYGGLVQTVLYTLQGV